MGDSSGEYPDADKTSHYLAAIAEDRQKYSTSESITDEEIVVQARLQIHKEYRVHTLEGRVIDDLTFLRYGRGNIPGERDRPNAWIQSLLDRLPRALVSQSLLGWDLALDPHGVMRVIEVNFTGFHPVFRPGFQCSGYYQDPEWGAALTGRLLRFVEKEHGLTIHVDVDCDDRAERAFHANVARWLGLFRAGHP